MFNRLDLKEKLESVYQQFNRKEFVDPDPLMFLYRFSDINEREIAGIIAASLAYGNVKQIVKSIVNVFNILHWKPKDFLFSHSDRDIISQFNDFKHRFTTGKEIGEFLCNLKATLIRHGSLNNCFLYVHNQKDTNVYPALCRFVDNVKIKYSGKNSLLSNPYQKSANKRLFLFLRWMIRSDDVDPGGWTGITSDKLIIPLDTHMHKIGIMLGATKCKNAGLTAAIEITDFFKEICPHDPVKYDFSLTRFGIRDELNFDMLFDT